MIPSPRLLLVAILFALPVVPAAGRPAPRHAAIDWTTTAIATPEGGVRIGNPKARLALVEYGSFTCPHCAAFASEAFPAIRDTYVRSGRVSFEFRAALRDRADLVAAVVTHCAPPPRFLATALAVFAAQADWERRAIEYDQQHPVDPAADADAVLGPLADGSGLAALAAKRGTTAPQLAHCLADTGLRDTLGKAASDAWNVRQIGGTPAFYLNGDKLDNVYGWAALEPYLRAALKN